MCSRPADDAWIVAGRPADLPRVDWHELARADPRERLVAWVDEAQDAVDNAAIVVARRNAVSPNSMSVECPRPPTPPRPRPQSATPAPSAEYLAPLAPESACRCESPAIHRSASFTVDSAGTVDAGEIPRQSTPTDALMPSLHPRHRRRRPRSRGTHEFPVELEQAVGRRDRRSSRVTAPRRSSTAAPMSSRITTHGVSPAIGRSPGDCLRVWPLIAVPRSTPQTVSRAKSTPSGSPSLGYSCRFDVDSTSP